MFCCILQQNTISKMKLQRIKRVGLSGSAQTFDTVFCLQKEMKKFKQEILAEKRSMSYTNRKLFSELTHAHWYKHFWYRHWRSLSLTHYGKYGLGSWFCFGRRLLAASLIKTELCRVIYIHIDMVDATIHSRATSK